MSFSQDFEAARKKRFEEKEEELRLRASLKEKSIEQQMLDKAQSEQMRKKADKDATVQAEIDAFRAEKKKTFSERFGDAMASKNADLFREYIDSARSDHLDDITRTGILEGTLPYEDVAKIYKDSIGDWNPQIKSEDDFELYDITRDFGYNADTNELEWYVNKVTGDDEEDFRRSVSYEQLHSEVGQGNISEYASLWNKDYKTPDVVEIEMPDGSINRISNDAWLKEYPDHKIPEMKAVIDAKKNDEGRLVNKSLYISDYNAEGWGRQQWGNSGWGVDYSISLTGQSATSSIGSVTAFDTQTVSLTGQSATSSIGSLTFDITSIVIPTGQQAQSELGDFDNAGTLVGWGRNGWGEEPYGDSFNKLVQPTGLSATSSVGTVTVADVIGITGQEATSAIGSPTLDITSVEALTAPSSLTASVGAISPTQTVVGLTGQEATATVGGIILDAVEIGLTGQEATSSIGSVTTEDSVGLTGQSATSSVGSVVLEIGVPLTGLSATSSVGTITPEDVIGLTGQEATSAVGEPAILGYADVDIDGNTSYTNVTKNNSASYSDVDVSGNTSYTDVDHAA